MDRAEKCDFTTAIGFQKWQALNKEIDRLQSPKIIEDYMNLEE